MLSIDNAIAQCMHSLTMMCSMLIAFRLHLHLNFPNRLASGINAVCHCLRTCHTRPHRMYSSWRISFGWMNRRSVWIAYTYRLPAVSVQIKHLMESIEQMAIEGMMLGMQFTCARILIIEIEWGIDRVNKMPHKGLGEMHQIRRYIRSMPNVWCLLSTCALYISVLPCPHIRIVVSAG